MASRSDHGAALLADAVITKGSAFTLAERKTLGLRGLLPSSVLSLDAQVDIAMASLARITDELGKYEVRKGGSDCPRYPAHITSRHTVSLLPPRAKRARVLPGTRALRRNHDAE